MNSFPASHNLAHSSLSRRGDLSQRATDEHVLSTIGALVLALLEGRTDLPIRGVFGTGKTRSAAILFFFWILLLGSEAGQVVLQSAIY